MVLGQVTEDADDIRAAVELSQKARSLGMGDKYSDPRQALGYLNQAIYLDADFAEAYKNRGLAHLQLDHPRQAITDLIKAIRLGTGDADAYLWRGLAYKKLGRFNEATADYDHAIRLDPGQARYYRNKGVVLKKMGLYQQAITTYDEAISRMFCEKDNLQILCWDCHQDKSNEEKAAAGKSSSNA